MAKTPLVYTLKGNRTTIAISASSDSAGKYANIVARVASAKFSVP